MYQINSPNNWSCNVAAFAMVLKVSFNDLIVEIGHDGSQVVFRASPNDPHKRRGFHDQELIDCCLRRGFSVTEIQASPVSCSFVNSGDVFEIPFRNGTEKRFKEHLKQYDGVLFGETAKAGHAVAWIDNVIYDPRGKIDVLETTDLQIRGMYVITHNIATLH